MTVDLEAIRAREKAAHSSDPWPVLLPKWSRLEAEIKRARYDIPALLVLVDELAAALLVNEWTASMCRECWSELNQGHDDDCRCDDALSAAGYPDQASRDAARARLNKVAPEPTTG